MYFKPNCFLIGAQKAGTTTVAGLLADQPDICVSDPKEPMFFSKNYAKGADWYRTKFRDTNKKILLDASPDYSRTPTSMFPSDGSFEGDIFAKVPERISRCNSEARFIYILRDPVMRSYSSYWHYVRAGYETKSDFPSAIRTSNRFLVASDYLGQLKNYLEYFQIEQFHFLLFEDFVKRPDLHIRQCCDFLGIEYEASTRTSAVHSNRSYQLNFAGRLLHKLTGSSKDTKRLSLTLKRMLPPFLIDSLREFATDPIPKLSQDDADYLFSMFSPSYRELEMMTGLDLTKWRSNAGF